LLAEVLLRRHMLATRLPEEREILERTEEESVRTALAACGGNHTHAAAMLGISYRTLARKLARMKATED